MIKFLLFVLPEHLRIKHIIHVFSAYNKLLYSWWKVSIHYYISNPVLYVAGHRSLSFVKDTFVSHGLLQFIQNNIN